MRLSEKLARAQQVTVDTKPLRAALRELQLALERNPHQTKLCVESLAKRPTIAVATLERGDDGVIVTLKPARDLTMLLTRAQR